MTRPLILHLLMAALAAAPASAAVTFEWAHVGNAGNAADPQTGYGAVAYEYAISKHEVTNAQYAEFLNAVDPTGANTLAMYNALMADRFGGIELQADNAISAKFTVKAGRAQNPVTLVSFVNAMRFTNWLHNGQGSGGTETGIYTIGNGLNEVRSADAKFWVPSEDEWYKAAYHDASAGAAGVYFDFATGSDSIPVSDLPGDNLSAVNYFNNDGIANGFNDGYAVNGSPGTFPSNPLTDVGAYTGAASPYGTFDQSGNVYEWNEAVSYDYARGLRSGTWDGDWVNMFAANRAENRPTDGYYNVGFRVAAVVPEPSSLLIGALAATGYLMRRRG